MTRWIPFAGKAPLVSIVRLQGAISARGGGLSDQSVAPLLEKAFRRGKPSAVALEINCPGGSPVQSALIAARIRRLASERDIPVYGFVEDVAASGGYWIATAADEIIADAASIVGSIGVIAAGFGVQDFIARHGIERRLHTSGKSKSFLDPFREEKPEDVARLKALMEEMHEIFIAQVRQRRGTKLSEDEALFSGAFWTGAGAVERGLVDRIGHLVPEMKARFGKKVRFRRYGTRKTLLRRLGAQMAADGAAAVEDRAAFARFGL